MKIRIKFSKQGNLRFVGHLDMMRYFQKANRRAELPIAYSEGFSPHQIMSFAAPLGMGLEGLAEYFDIRIAEGAEGRIHSADAVRELNAQMAEGVEILSFLKIPDDAKNCMSIVRAADYHIYFPSAPAGCESETLHAALHTACQELLAREQIPVKKQGKNGKERELDIRPMIFSLSADGAGLKMRIAQGSEANLKPELLLSALFITEAGVSFADLRYRIVRTELYDAEMRTLESYGEFIE